MKTLLSFLVVLACVIAAAQTIPPPANPPAPPPAASPGDGIAKELADAKAQIAALAAQQQQTSVVAEYYKAVAERNQAVLNLNAAIAELEATRKARDEALARERDLRSRLDLEKAKVEELLKHAPPGATVTASKPAEPAKK